MDITASAQWSELAKVYEEKKDLNLRELFAADADRARNFTFDAAGLHVDLSKNLIDGDVVETLLALGEEAQLRDRIVASDGGCAMRMAGPAGISGSSPSKSCVLHVTCKTMSQSASAASCARSRARAARCGDGRADDGWQS